jgi:hypothetical protein
MCAFVLHQVMQQNQALLISPFPRHLSKQIVRCSISADAPITIMQDRKSAEEFVKAGWAPTLIVTGKRIITARRWRIVGPRPLSE